MKRRISRRFRPAISPRLDQLASRQLLSTGFQVATSPAVDGSNLDAIAAVSPTDIWAVGDRGSGPTTLVENFNGTSWTQVATVSGQLFAISGSSANNVYAVGESIATTDEPLVERWNGSTWSVVTSANPSAVANSFSGVTALGNGFTVAVGSVGIESKATSGSPAFLSSNVVANGSLSSPATSPVPGQVDLDSSDGTSAPSETSPVPVPGGDGLDPLRAPHRRRDHIALG
jgi:hypothetical protein